MLGKGNVMQKLVGFIVDGATDFVSADAPDGEALQAKSLTEPDALWLDYGIITEF